MKIERLELRLLELPLVHFFETSFGRVDDKHFILVRADGDGASGYGECVADTDPYYSAETNETAWHIISEFIAPRVLGVELAHPRDVFPALKAIRGHNMAKAAVEMAAWDLYARQRREPLWRTLGGVRDRIASGVSVGIQPSLADLAANVERELAAGYRRIKIKVKPGWDLDPVRTIRERFGSIPLMVDANAAYTAGDAEHLARLDEYGLMMIEQPLDYDDIAEHAHLQRRLKTAICLDESIKSPGAAREAIAAGACRIINIKPGRIGGFGESIRLHDLCAGHGIPVWHGGMLESGIGRAPNIALCSLGGFTDPADMSPASVLYEDDLIDPTFDVEPDGCIEVPSGSGLGYRVDEERVRSRVIRWVELDGDGTVRARGEGKEKG